MQMVWLADGLSGTALTPRAMAVFGRTEGAAAGWARRSHRGYRRGEGFNVN